VLCFRIGGSGGNYGTVLTIRSTGMCVEGFRPTRGFPTSPALEMTDKSLSGSRRITNNHAE
jgi:hypothetical protein